MLFRWYRELKPNGKNTFHAAFGGWALDAFDYMIYTFVIGSLIAAWGISKTDAGAIALVTAITAAIGGVAAGVLADKYGRVRVLQWTILWFTAATCLIGFTTNYTQLMILRALQGFGFGGEWAIGAVLIGEIVETKYRGRAVGTVQSGWAVGWMAAALVAALAFAYLPKEYAWRSLFWFSIIPSFIVIYIRRNVHEPEVFVKAKEETKDKVSVAAIFSPKLLKTTILASLLCTGAQGGYYAVVTWIPTFLKEQHGLSISASLPAMSMLIAGSFVGYLVGAFLTDKLGRKANILFFAVLAGLSVFAYTRLKFTADQLLFVGFPLGFAASGVFSGLGAYLSELFPSEVRATGQGFSYNFGRLVGAAFPMLVGYMTKSMSLGEAISLFAGVAYGVLVLAVIFLPETKNKKLRNFSDLPNEHAPLAKSTVQ